MTNGQFINDLGDEPETDEVALQYEQEAGDVSHWTPSKRRIRVRRGGPSHSFSVRFAPEELDLLQAEADRREVTITEFIRSAALNALRQEDGLAENVAAVRSLAEDLQGRLAHVEILLEASAKPPRS